MGSERKQQSHPMAKATTAWYVLTALALPALATGAFLHYRRRRKQAEVSDIDRQLQRWCVHLAGTDVQFDYCTRDVENLRGLRRRSG